MSKISEVTCKNCGHIHPSANTMRTYQPATRCNECLCGTPQTVTAKEAPALKYDAGKLRYDLVDQFSIAWLTSALTYGASKYAAWNHLKFSDEEIREKYVASLERHFSAWRMGEFDDEETGLPHVGMMLFSAMVLCSRFAPRDLNEIRARTAEAIRRWEAKKLAGTINQ